MANPDELELWRQDLQWLWTRWQPLEKPEQEWLVEDFVRRAEADPERLAGILELVSQDLERLESLDWLTGDPELSPTDEGDEDLPALADLNLPESKLLPHRDGLMQLLVSGQARLDTLWLKGVQV